MSFINHSLLMFFFLSIASCTQAKIASHGDNVAVDSTENQIGQYIVEMFEDSKGNLWFGTLSKGIARYDGKALSYITVKNGLIGNAVVSMIEDKKGNIWFGTQSGLSKYDGEKFTSYTKLDGLVNERISGLMIDSQDNLWIRTWEGITIYDGTEFRTFELPEPEVDNPSYLNTMRWITTLHEDDDGNIWIGRDGFGATKYDGKNFTFYTKKDGLYSNNITNIVVDDNRDIWFGTRIIERDNPDPVLRKGPGGVQLYKNGNMVDIPELAPYKNSDNYMINKDISQHIWLGINGVGLMRFDGNNYELFDEFISESHKKPTGFTGIFDDSHGNKWLSTNEGLYKFQDSLFVNITEEGILKVKF